MKIDYLHRKEPRLTDCFLSHFQKEKDLNLSVFGYLYYEATIAPSVTFSREATRATVLLIGIFLKTYSHE